MTFGGTQSGSGDCPAAEQYGDETVLFGKDWLLTNKHDPSTSGAVLLRCHYVHGENRDIDLALDNAMSEALTGDLVPPPTVITDLVEVRKILASLPDSTDVSRRCGPAGGRVDSFDEYTVLDQAGTPTAKFQTSEHGACGVLRVIPPA